MARPTRARGRVLTFAFLLAVVTYLDRVCISAAAPAIRRDLGLSLEEMSVVFSAFTLAYAIFEVPSGWLGDVRGPRSSADCASRGAGSASRRFWYARVSCWDRPWPPTRL